MNSKGITRTIANNPLHIKCKQAVLGGTTGINGARSMTRQGVDFLLTKKNLSKLIFHIHSPKYLPGQLSVCLLTKTGSEGAAETRPKIARAGKMNFMANEYVLDNEQSKERGKMVAFIYYKQQLMLYLSHKSIIILCDFPRRECHMDTVCWERIITPE